MNTQSSNDCSGCTDKMSEGTHQMHTTQHPCPDGGDPNCGYCFPETYLSVTQSSNGCCDVRNCVKTETHTHSFQATGDRMLLVPEGMSYNGEHGPTVVREPSPEEWKKSVVDAVISMEGGTSRNTKIRIITELLTADRERVRSDIESLTIKAATKDEEGTATMLSVAWEILKPRILALLTPKV